MRARGVSPWSARPCSLTISRAAEASEICEAQAAVTRPPSVRVGSERILSQFGSRGPSSAVHVAERDDLGVEAALGPGPDGPLVRLDRERLHVLAGDVPLLGDHLGRAELADLLRAVAGHPTLGPRERVVEAELLADEHRRRDGDLRHLLHAARRRRRPSSPTARPGPRSGWPAAASRTGGRRWCRARARAARPRASRCGRCRRPARRSSRRCRTRRPRPPRGRCPCARRGPRASAPRGRRGAPARAPRRAARRGCALRRRCRPRPCRSPRFYPQDFHSQVRSLERPNLMWKRCQYAVRCRSTRRPGRGARTASPHALARAQVRLR